MIYSRQIHAGEIEHNEAYHNLGYHLLCDILRITHGHLLLLMEISDFVVDFAPYGADVSPLDL